nr:hypothetical protein [Tanacetum cinerariifolium]
MQQQHTIASNIYRQKTQRAMHHEHTNGSHIQRPQPDWLQQCLSDSQCVRCRHTLQTKPTYLHNSTRQGAAVSNSKDFCCLLLQ